MTRAIQLIALLVLAGWTHAETAILHTRNGPSGEWSIVVGTSHVASAAGSNVVATFFADYPRIAEQLGVAPTSVPRRVEVFFAPDLPQGVPAHTSGHRMRISSAHAAQHPGDLRGLLIHEWTHTVQAYPNPAPTWITEGLADAVRLLLSPPGDPWRTHVESRPRAQSDYRRGYGEAACFLLWIRDQGHPTLLTTLNRLMRERAYEDSWWTTSTGAPLESWWTRYRTAP